VCIFSLFVSQNALVQLLFTQHWAFIRSMGTDLVCGTPVATGLVVGVGDAVVDCILSAGGPRAYGGEELKQSCDFAILTTRYRYSYVWVLGISTDAVAIRRRPEAIDQAKVSVALILLETTKISNCGS
jgi:hypothetical protein